MPDVLVVGHICLDILPALDRAPEFEPGNLYEIGPATFAPGGGVANVGLALRRLGVDASLIGQIGNDAFGAILRERVESSSAGSGDTLAVSDEAATSYTVVLSHPGADRIFLHHPGCNATFDPSTVELGDRDAKVLYFGYPPLMAATFRDGGRALADWFGRARDRGLTTVLDLAMPDPEGASGGVDWAAFLAKVLPSIDLIVPSAHEVGVMLDGVPPERAEAGAPPTEPERRLAQRLLELGAGAVALTLGEHGLLLATGRDSMPNVPQPEAWTSRELWAPTFQTDQAGTTGAGDATTAGLVASLLRGLDPEHAATVAAAVAACSVEAPDATSGVQGWDDTRKRIGKGWGRTADMVTQGEWRVSGTVFRGPLDRAGLG